MKYFHFISSDNALLTEINNYVCTGTIIKSHHNKEEFISLFKSMSESLVFFDIDLYSESESISSIIKLNQVVNKVIVVSKDTEFAYRAIKIGVHDYILKSDFTKESLNTNSKSVKKESIKDSVSNKVAIHCNDAVHYLSLSEIIRCKAESNYTWIITKEKNILIAKTLKKIEALLPSASFYRTHRSHIVNLKHIKMVKHEKGGTIVTSDDFNTPISRNRKSFYLDKIQSAIM